MEQKLLYKMFNGEATDSEVTQIRQWVNADKANRETFYHERALFDEMCIRDRRQLVETSRKPSPVVVISIFIVFQNGFCAPRELSLIHI